MSGSVIRTSPRFRYYTTFNTGVVSTGTPFLPSGMGTASVGIVIDEPVHLTGIRVITGISSPTTSGQVDATVTVWKNANSGVSNRVFVVTFTDMTAVGQIGSSTTVVDSGMDAFNGTTDYFTIGVTITGSTSANFATMQVVLLGTYD
jgi:hypothetical protein